MDTTEITHISLCSGYGGIDLGLRRVISNLRTVAYAEIEAFAIECLLARMEGGQLDAAPIWSDLKSFPCAEFSGLVDILSGGYPCQPFSTAGKRAGADDPRHLWPYIRDGIRRMAPRLCFFENVEGHISLGLREVITELESLGYQTAWGIFSAAECGAPHQRKRVFILAHRKGERLEGYDGLLAGCGESRWVTQEPQGWACRRNYGRDVWPSRPGEPQYAWEPPRVVVDSASKRASSGRELRGTQCGQEQGLSSQSDDAGAIVGNADCGRQSLGFDSRGGAAEDCRGQDHAQQADSGAVVGNTQSREDNGRKPGNMGCATSERGCGNDAANGPSEGVGESTRELPHGSGTGSEEAGCSELADSSEREVEPTLGGDIDGTPGGLDDAELCVSCDNRTDELRLLGNGVVPATAALAFRTLLDEIQFSVHE